MTIAYLSTITGYGYFISFYSVESISTRSADRRAYTVFPCTVKWTHYFTVVSFVDYFRNNAKMSQIGSTCRTWHWGAFVKQLLRCKTVKYYIFWVCVCGLRYPGCNVHAPYCHLWPVRLCNIFPHYLIKGKIFDEHQMCFSIFPTTFVWNISHSNNNWARYYRKCISVFM